VTERSPSPAGDPLYLDDLRVGQRFVSGTYTLGEAEIIEFARRFDPQPFHLDPRLGEKTMLGGLAASGWHTAAITMRLLVDGGPPIAGGIIGAGGEIAWPQPTRPGDILQVQAEVTDVRPSRSRPDRGIVMLSTETRNQRGEVVQTFAARLFVRRRGDDRDEGGRQDNDG
jgi:acyl dehydratase